MRLNIYAPTATTTPAQTVAMAPDVARGVCPYTAADASLANAANYTYDITAYSRLAGSVVLARTDVTDPLAPSLSGNGKYGMVLDLAHPATQPTGWPGALPASGATTDASTGSFSVPPRARPPSTGIRHIEGNPDAASRARQQNPGLDRIDLGQAMPPPSPRLTRGLLICPRTA